MARRGAQNGANGALSKPPSLAGTQRYANHHVLRNCPRPGGVAPGEATGSAGIALLGPALPVRLHVTWGRWSAGGSTPHSPTPSLASSGGEPSFGTGRPFL